MNRDHIEGSCKEFDGNVIKQRDDLTENRAGNRIRKTYGITDDAMECDFTDWLKRLNGMGRVVVIWFQFKCRGFEPIVVAKLCAADRSA